MLPFVPVMLDGLECPFVTTLYRVFTYNDGNINVIRVGKVRIIVTRSCVVLGDDVGERVSHNQGNILVLSG